MLERFIETAPIGICRFDEYGILQSANPAALEIFGVSSKKLVGQDLSALFPTVDWTVDDGSIFNIELLQEKFFPPDTAFELKRNDGSIRLLDISVSETGQCGNARFCAIVRDITSRVESRKALLTDEQRLHLIISSITSSVTVNDHDAFTFIFDSAA